MHTTTADNKTEAILEIRILFIIFLIETTLHLETKY